MTEYSYDVTKPDNGISTVQVPPRKSSKIVYYLIFILLILTGVIVYLLMITKSCNFKKKSENLFGIFDKGNTTTEAVSTVDLRFIQSTTMLPSEKADDIRKNNTCMNTECLQTAAHILSSMDLTREPCENFYDYACGNMDSQNEENIDIFNPQLYIHKDTPNFLKKFHSFYESCVSHEDRFDYEKRLNRTRELLNRVGKFHIHGQKKKDINITQIIGNLVLYEAMPLFDMNVDIDAENNFIIKLLMPDQTSLDFDHWSPLSETKRKCLRETAEQLHRQSLNMTKLYETFLLCQKDYGDYLDSISTSILELKIFSKLTEGAILKRLFDIRTFMEFEILSIFDQIPLPPNLHELRVKRQYEEIKLGQLKDEFPILDWVYLFKIISNKTMTDETKIQMYNRGYFEDVFDRMINLPLDKLSDALLAILASSLYINTVLPSHRHTREKYCQERSRELMPDIVNYLYKQVINSEDLNKKNAEIKTIYEVLRERFRNELQNRTWLDTTGKSSILKKLDKIQLLMFENDDIQSEKKYLEDVYKKLEILNDNYQYNRFNLIEFKRKRLFSLHGKKVSEEDMFRYAVDATKEDPVYFYANDIVCIPYGLARKYNANLPKYMILAQVGFPIAKVIGQAFDRIGIGYGVDLSKKSLNSYANFADSSRDTIILTNPITLGEKDVYFNLNTDLSESERISDNTAMRLMTESFISFENQSILPWISHDFSKEKVFFIFLTQGLCQKMDLSRIMVEAFESPVLPPQFRVESMLSNSQEFLNTFGCPPGSGMNLLEDRLQFPYLK